MKKLRVIARALVIKEDKILLVRNKGAKFWYPPGGGWEFEKETIIECVVREVEEESSYKVVVDRMLWTQEFHESDQSIFFETFWLTRLDKTQQPTDEAIKTHIDLDPNGAVEELRWYTSDSLKDITVFPKRIKQYQQLIEEQSATADPFIGVS
jgi:ADP-ribose pyrophosphatase YjhB (NUDIX family)